MNQKGYKSNLKNAEPIKEKEKLIKASNFDKKYQPKLIMLVVQISVCLLILGGATLLKSFGGNCFDFVKQWYNEKINDSIIVEKSINEYQTVIREKFPKNAKFVNYSSKNIPEILLTVNLHSPLHSGRITSKFGKRSDPITGKEKFHNGLDISAELDTPIHAVLPGTVTQSERIGGYGNCIILDHGNNIKTLYAHCNRLNVTTGDIVNRGQEVASVGSSGKSTGEHLHFEILINEKKMNPEKFLNNIYI